MGALLSGKTRYKRLGGSQGLSGWVRGISPPTGIRFPDCPVAIPNELSRPTIWRPKCVLLLLATWFFHKVITIQHSKFSYFWQWNVVQQYTKTHCCLFITAIVEKVHHHVTLCSHCLICLLISVASTVCQFPESKNSLSVIQILIQGHLVPQSYNSCACRWLGPTGLR